jgi:hypothetical protein
MGLRARSMGAAFALVLYVVALLLPTIGSVPLLGVVYGGVAFRIGWQALCLFEPGEAEWWVICLAWLANMLIGLAFLTTITARQQTTRVAATSGILLSQPVLFWYSEMIAGQPGYWTWVSSAAVLLGLSVPQWSTKTSGQWKR